MEKHISIETSNKIKFCCAILIVLHHYFQFFFTSTGYSAEHTFLFLIIQQLGYTGVAVFFFLSGYGLMESEKRRHLTLKEFISRRFFKIYFPYLLVTSLWLPVLYSVVKSNENPGITNIIYNLLWNGEDNVLWFIKILLLLYIMFYVYTSIHRKDNHYAKAALIAMTIMCCIIAYYTIGYYSYISVPIFTLGIIYSIYQDKEFTKNNPFIRLFIAACVAIGISAILCQNIFFMMQSVVNFSIILLLVLSIRKWDSEAKRKKRKVLDYSVSFDIYLIHNKVLMVFATFFHQSTMNSFITYLLLVFVFSFLFFRLRKTCKI